MEITWRVISGEREVGNGGNVQVISSINGRYKIDGGGLEQYRKWKSQRTYLYKPMDMN